jgi:RNase adapter protein RapZ
MDQQKRPLQIMIVTGLSGSGKSTVSRVLEDLGFYCVDNMPVALLPRFFELPSASFGDHTKIALVMDLREKHFLQTFPDVFSRARAEDFPLEILFLEASDEVLVRRYSQTRRAHPLAGDSGVLEGIHREREMLAGIRSLATLVIDTSTFNVHNLEQAIRDLFVREAPGGRRRMALTFLSFGFSRGVPPEADLVIDVRFLPNPYFVEELKTLAGTDHRIEEYLFQFEETRAFCGRFQSLLEFLLPYYEREGKAYLTVAIGCTGGKHRSVAVAEKLSRTFQGHFPVRLRHRDLEDSK